MSDLEQSVVESLDVVGRFARACANDHRLYENAAFCAIAERIKEVLQKIPGWAPQPSWPEIECPACDGIDPCINRCRPLMKK